MKPVWENIKKRVPLWSAILFGIFLIALAVEGLSRSHVALAEWVHNTPGAGIRFVLAMLTSPLPFSVAEFLLLASPVILVWLCVTLVRRARKGSVALTRYVVSLLCVLSSVYAIFVFGFGTGYYAKPVAEKVGLDRKAVSDEELYETALALIEEIKADIPSVLYPEKSYSAMSFSYHEMNQKLNEAYGTVCDRYPSLQRMNTNTKPVMLSEPWTYTHISGLYCFFTGEANVNINYPDYIVISSAAHEMAHQRGIAKEDEANFVAFLVCLASDDPYIRYSGCADVLSSVMSDLRAANKELHAKALAELPAELRGEYSAYGTFFAKYRENVAADISDKINDVHITTHGQPAGVASYGLVVDLVVAYMLYGRT